MGMPADSRSATLKPATAPRSVLAEQPVPPLARSPLPGIVTLIYTPSTARGSNLQGTVLPGGLLCDGALTGVLHVQGDYEQQADGTLWVELGGTTPGDGCCVLDATGSAALDGQLVIATVDGFTPEPGDEFEIVSAGTVSGAFSSVTADGRYCVSYAPASVTIALAGFGDITLDCAVDMADYAYFEDCAAGPGVSPNPALPGVTVQDCLDTFDSDADGDVDLKDFARFQLAFTGGNG